MTPTRDVTFQAGAASVSATIVGSVKHTTASGWVETARPLRKSMVEWTGKPLDRLTVPIVLDEWPDGGVQGEVDTLVGWMRRPGGAQTPPTVTCHGPRLPLDVTGRQWALEAVELGDDQLFREDGVLCRQDAVVTLLEQPDDDPTVVKVKADRNPRDIILARRGDTIETVARRELGSAAKAAAIRRLNPGLKAGKPIPPGTVVVIP